MTTVVAGFVNGDLLVATDNQITGNNGVVIGIGDKTWVKHNLIYGFAGDVAAIQLVKSFLNCQEESWFREEPLSCDRVFMQWVEMRAAYRETFAPEDDEDKNRIPVTFVVGDTSGLFSVTSTGGVVEHGEYCAIGSGAEFALGALYVATTERNQRLREEYIISAMHAASAFDTHTGRVCSLSSIEGAPSPKDSEDDDD